MKTTLSSSVAITLALAFILAGTNTTADAAEPATVRGGCTVSFAGSSTLHGFEGTAACESFILERVDDNATTGPSTWKTRIRVAVATMSTDNAGRDGKMAKMFGVETYPWIEASLDSIQPGPLDTLEFQLTIGQSTRTVIAEISDHQETNDHASFTASFSLSLAEYGLVPPSVFGIIRVADEVTVRVVAVVTRDN